jgi:hypothetical protein
VPEENETEPGGEAALKVHCIPRLRYGTGPKKGPEAFAAVFRAPGGTIAYPASNAAARS